MRRVGALGVRWPGYAAAVWGLLFAVPSFVWALGSTAGAQTTVSPSLVKLAQDRPSAHPSPTAQRRSSVSV
jgi:hypothetical protein